MYDFIINIYITGYHDLGRLWLAGSQDTDLSRRVDFHFFTALCDDNQPTIQTDRQTCHARNDRTEQLSLWRACRCPGLGRILTSAAFSPSSYKYRYINNQSTELLLKVIWEKHTATPHGRECTRPLCVLLTVQCPLQTSRQSAVGTLHPHRTAIYVTLCYPITLSLPALANKR